MKKFLATTIAFVMSAVVSTAALADNTLVIGNYNNAPDSVKERLEAAGHTVTIQRDTNNPPADISAYDQIWDLRWNTSLDATTTAQYDDFVKNGGFLFMATENPGCCNVPNATKAALITQMGGGDTTIGGTAGSTENQVVNGTNTTYMTSGLTVNFSAISAIENTQGTALITDANGKIAAMMWVGNANDLGSGYTGTVITIADINWLAQGFTNVDQVADNTQALDDIINGVVAGTVAGTISDTGNGAGSTVGGGGTTPTLVSSADGTPIVTTSDSNGGSITTIAITTQASENATEQTIVKTITTTVTTATNTETCTTPTTVNTYSDGNTTTVNGTETCATTTAYNATSSSASQTFTGRIDQTTTADNMLSMANRRLSFDGVNFVADIAEMNNGMTGGVGGVTFGGAKDLDSGLHIGAGFGRLTARVRDVGTANVESTLVNLHGSKEVEQGRVDFSLTYAMNDYVTTRIIGDYANSGETTGTDTWANVTFTGTGERIRPVLGITRGVRTIDGYTESGSVQSARTVADTVTWYTYGTVGAQATIKDGITAQALHHSDGVNSLSIAINKEITKDTRVAAGISRNVSRSGATNSIIVGLVKKF